MDDIGDLVVLIGRTVEFPTALSEYRVGTVKEIDEKGRLVVVDDDGHRWCGYEDQILMLDTGDVE